MQAKTQTTKSIWNGFLPVTVKTLNSYKITRCKGIPRKGIQGGKCEQSSDYDRQ